MIKLFRNIRKSLLNEGKTSKYLKYALGEIILVVIGILIAFQVNTWNQKNSDLKDQEAVFKKLNHDLEGDYLRLSVIDSLYTIHLEKLIYQKNVINQSKLSDSDIEKVMFYTGASFYEIKPRKTAYDEMLHSGKIYKLTNDQLVDQIIEYYRNINDEIYNIRQGRNEFRALFYGPELTELWFWRADAQPYSYARSFFDNQNTKAYKLLKQSAGWSQFIVEKQLKNNQQLLIQNRNLKESIDHELYHLK